jgi:flagellar motor switch protein FliN/FliY
MTNNQTADNNSQSFSDAFFGALVAAMSENSETAWAIAAMPDKDSAPDELDPVRMKIALGGTLRGAFLLEFRRAEAVLLVSKLLQQPVDEFGAEQSEALKRLIEVAMSKFRSALEHEYGTFTIEACFASEAPSSREDVVQITAADGGANHVSVLMYLNPELTESLLLHSRAVSSVAGARKAMKVVAGNAVPEPVNLDLVMDVELNVTLRFGQRQLTLREVMELTSGSVVELDRQVEEPVELLLNGMVIARGEAVVIDGNYGLRVTEVSQPVSSLTLH